MCWSRHRVLFSLLPLMCCLWPAHRLSGATGDSLFGRPSPAVAGWGLLERLQAGLSGGMYVASPSPCSASLLGARQRQPAVRLARTHRRPLFFFFFFPTVASAGLFIYLLRECEKQCRFYLLRACVSRERFNLADCRGTEGKHSAIEKTSLRPMSKRRQAPSTSCCPLHRLPPASLPSPRLDPSTERAEATTAEFTASRRVLRSAGTAIHLPRPVGTSFSFFWRLGR